MTSNQFQQPQLALNWGIVKQVLSGDSVIIRGQPKGGPPPEKQLCLSNIMARKLARRPNPNADASAESKDEPYAWEAREFLRKKIVGKEIVFTVEYKVPASGREYGSIYLGKDASGENLTELLVAEGLVEVRRGGLKLSEEQQRLCELEDVAKSAGKGLWGNEASKHVRDIKWTIDNPRHFVDSLHTKPVKAVIEHVRDGSTVRAFLLPGFQYVTLMMSGIRCPMFKVGDDGSNQQGEAFAEEAKYFTESRLLQRDVEIVLESVSNANFLGSVLHPCGNIAELLLREGFARCVDWSMAFVSLSVEKLRTAEKVAKSKQLRIWKDYSPSTPQINAKDREFVAKVVEVVNADALVVKTNNGTAKKVFLASIRPPRLPDTNQPEPQKDAKGRQFRPLYDIPFMYEAREFLRQKLIGKDVNVTVDYLQPPSNSFPERACCTVTIGGINVAEALVSKGLATVVRYRQDDDRRSSHYDDLLAAESKAVKGGRGLHGKEVPNHRIADISGDSSKAKQFLPFLQRAGRAEAVVEYVGSGSRLRLYIPKETCLVTFLLAGISCPRASRPAPGGGNLAAEPFGEEAMVFTKEKCLQREVEVQIESMDKAGNFIGWLWIGGVNLSLMLVQDGFASVHATAERSSHYRSLQLAEDKAKERKTKIWANYVEPVDDDALQDTEDRLIDVVPVIITEICSDLSFYAQRIDKGPQLEELMSQLREEFSSNPPVPGSYTPKRGDVCAAKFVDGQWYRAKVEKISQDVASIIYIDYGNKEVTKMVNLATLPLAFRGESHASEYSLACVQLGRDADFRQEAVHAFSDETHEQSLLLNVEYKVVNQQFVTLLNSNSKEDVARSLIADGLLIVEQRKERRLQKLVTEYKNAQEAAKKKRLNMWEYGDFLEDDAKEFGYQRN